MQEKVTVCVPVYNGAAFVKETLLAIQKQSYQNFEVLVSIDCGDDESFEVCLPFTQDERFKIFQQNERLGWAGNTNSMIGKVQSEYFCVVPHDDLIHEDYIQLLLTHIQQFPEAAAVYSQTQSFGNSNSKITQASVLGNKFDRVLSVLSSNSAYVLFRALIRRSIAGEIKIPVYPYESYASDNLWALQLACRGSLHQLEQPLYRKRQISSSASHQWGSWPLEKLLLARLEHCYQCASVILAEGFPPEQQQLLLFACLTRFLKLVWGSWLYKDKQKFSEMHKLTLVNLWVTRLLGMNPPHENQLFTLLTDSQNVKLLADLYDLEAENAARLGQFEQAIQSMHQAITQQPGVSQFHRRLSQFLAQQGQHEEAIAAVRQAIDLEETAEYHSHCGMLLVQADRLDDAESHYRRAIQLSPNQATIYHRLSLVLLRQKQIPAAIEAQQRAIELEPDNPQIQSHYGLLLAQADRFEEAESYQKRAISLNSDVGVFYHRLSVVLFQKQQISDAVQAAERSIALEPDNRQFQTHLTKVLVAASTNSPSNCH